MADAEDELEGTVLEKGEISSRGSGILSGQEAMWVLPGRYREDICEDKPRWCKFKVRVLNGRPGPAICCCVCERKLFNPWVTHSPHLKMRHDKKSPCHRIMMKIKLENCMEITVLCLALTRGNIIQILVQKSC